MTREANDDHAWELRPATDIHLPVGERLRSLSRERGLLDTMTGLAWWNTVRVYMRTYHRLRIEGAEQLPKAPPFVLVANHSSHLDAMALASVLPRRLRSCVYPVAAGDHFFRSLGTASFAAFALNALPIPRHKTARYALQQLRNRLTQEPCGLILFPEGTRSRTGEIAPFKPGLGMIVAGTEVPVIPCHLEGAFAALPPDRKLPRPGRISLRIDRPLTFEGTRNNRQGWNDVTKSAEAAVRKAAKR